MATAAPDPTFLCPHFPMAKAYLLHTGSRSWHESGIELMPMAEALRGLEGLLSGAS